MIIAALIRSWKSLRVFAHRAGASGVMLAVVLTLGGCGKVDVDSALDSDANGYVCQLCPAKFYTDRKVFPTKCPDCKKPNIQQAVMFICQADKQVNLGSRTVRSVTCQKCGKPATGLGIPREADLKAWGASHKTATDVN